LDAHSFLPITTPECLIKEAGDRASCSQKMHLGLHNKVLLLLPDFNQN
jgi:hypothetical protein